jgi:hypothetical protein
MTRRSLFAAAAAFVASFQLATAEMPPASGIPAASLTNGMALGCQAWSFNKFTAFEAIEKTAASGAKCIELYPGQKLAPDSEAKVGPGMAQEDVLRLKAQLLKHNVTATAFGVTGIPKDEAAAKGLFEFAKTMGLRCINTESTDAIDTAEKMAKTYDIRVGYHNHPKKEKDPNYKVWDPNYILELVKGRDPRVGACADTGHWWPAWPFSRAGWSARTSRISTRRAMAMMCPGAQASAMRPPSSKRSRTWVLMARCRWSMSTPGRTICRRSRSA